MKATLIFNHLNDLLYLNCCQRFADHVKDLAFKQGLTISPSSEKTTKQPYVDPDIIFQLFSPLVASQRFMREQFGNPYESVQCDDGTNVVFKQYMGNLFLSIGTAEISLLKRQLGVCTVLVSYICGPDMAMLKSSKRHSDLLDSLIKSWEVLYSSNNSFMLEAIEQANLSSAASGRIMKSLQQITQKSHNKLGNHVHSILFSGTKLVSWYSTKGSAALGTEDALFFIILCHAVFKGALNFNISPEPVSSVVTADISCSGETISQSSSIDASSAAFSADQKTISDQEDEDECFKNYSIIFGSEKDLYLPLNIRCAQIHKNTFLVLASEPPNSALVGAICSTFILLLMMYNLPRNPVVDKQLFEQLDGCIKKLLEALKKAKNATLRQDTSNRWEKLKCGFQAYMKSKDPIAFQLVPLMDIVRESFRKYMSENGSLSSSPFLKRKGTLDEVWKVVANQTKDFPDLITNGQKILSHKEKRGLPMNKYLEEFPGLVHFIYIDRNKHIATMPGIDYSKEDTVRLTNTKIREMIRFAREHVQQGHFSLMWKDSTFNYAYFLWFEDPMGNAIKASSIVNMMPWEGYPVPGIFCGDFYKKLIGDSFPNSNSSKVRCLELFCIHLGLATSSCVLEHSKRLATNIFDEYSRGNPASDLL